MTLQLNDLIQETFEPSHFALLTTRLGYDVKAGFLPEEIDDFTKLVVKYVLDKIKNGQEAGENEGTLRERVSTLVSAEIQKICKIVPQSQVFYKHPKAGWLSNWLFSWLS